MTSGPLSGYRIIELAGIGPGPYAGQLIADLGAEVICLERPASGSIPGAGPTSIDRRHKKSLILDLKQPGAAEIVLRLVRSADALIEGNRPGVVERLGIGPEACHAVNPRLVYGRMTGWGQNGPWEQMAGHDINYIAITGALQAMGAADRPPPPPLNLVGDYGSGSMLLVMGLLAALLQAQKTGAGEIVDAAIIDGTNSMMGIIHSLSALGLWSPTREANMLDGHMPFYRCYETEDRKYMAVGCIEPQFFALMLEILGIEPIEFGGQYDANMRKAQHTALEAKFREKTRDQWAALFDGTDACVTPVLDYEEANSHKQNIARRDTLPGPGLVHPTIVPKFEKSNRKADYSIPSPGAHSREILEALGFDAEDIAQLIKSKVVHDGLAAV